MPEAWDRLCIDIEQAVKSYHDGYAYKYRERATAFRKNDCVHIEVASDNNQRRALDVCMNRESMLVFSRKADGIEVTRMPFSSDDDGNACFKDEHGNLLTMEQVSELFLYHFLFTENR